MRRSIRDTLVPWLIAGLAAAGGAALATEPPDSQLNPVTGNIESVDTDNDNGSSEVRHVVDSGQGAPAIASALGSSGIDDLSPRIAIRADGTTAVAWWRHGSEDTVVLRKRDPLTGVWAPEIQVSEPGEGSRHPEIVNDGSAFWVAWEHDLPGGDTGISVRSILDDPEPFPTRTLLGLTGYGGDVDATTHYAFGKLWVTWIDGSADVAWSMRNAASGAWSAPSFESYAVDDVGSARQRVRIQIIGN